jgi:heavy metal sensor kinase
VSLPRGGIGRGWRALGTLRVRLTLWYVGLLALILLAFCAVLYVSLERTLHAEIDSTLEAQYQRMVTSIRFGARTPPPDLRDVILRRRPPIAGTAVAFYDPSGEVLLFGETWEELPDLADVRAGAVGGARDLRTIVAADGEPWRVLTGPVQRDGRLPAVIQVARSERDVRAALGHLLFEMAVAIPLTLCLAVAVGLFLAGRALDPIDRITRTADQIGAENLSRRLDLPANDDEVGRLAATFDRMLDRLERAFRRQRQFAADASHELRTPLAMLTTQAELALERRRTPAEYQQALTSVRDDARRMGQLLGELLTLARADAGEESLSIEPLDLADLAADVVAAMEPLAQGRGVTLRHPPAGSIIVRADQTRLTQLVINLVDNGLKYTPAGGTVTVSTERADGWAALRVADTGHGIAREHLPHVFERFYRVDEARARAEGGAGLGLAISRWIAEAHGGTIGVESEPGRGTTFIVRLPLASSSSADEPRPDDGRPGARRDPEPSGDRAPEPVSSPW